MVPQPIYSLITLHIVNSCIATSMFLWWTWRQQLQLWYLRSSAHSDVCFPFFFLLCLLILCSSFHDIIDSPLWFIFLGCFNYSWVVFSPQGFSSCVQVCYEADIPFIAFRSLSDLAGGGTGPNQISIFGDLAADNAALFVTSFFKLLEWITSWILHISLLSLCDPNFPKAPLSQTASEHL